MEEQVPTAEVNTTTGRARLEGVLHQRREAETHAQPIHIIPESRIGQSQTGLGVDYHGLQRRPRDAGQCLCQGNRCWRCFELAVPHLRRRVLAARAWFRWGRQLYDSVESNRVAWDSLGPTAQDARRWYRHGWSGEEADRLTKKYGHGMLRTGRDRGSYLSQQAMGSVADRVRSELL